MVLGVNPDVGAIDRSAIDRWDNAACEIGVYLTDTFTVTVNVTDPSISCSMTDTFEVRAAITIPYININSLCRRAEVSRSVAHPFWTAKFTFDKGVTGGRTSSLFFSTTPVVLFMTDYSGKTNPVFCGVIPSEQRRHNSWMSEETFTGYSYAWYLSKQYLPTIANTRVYVNSLVDLVYYLTPWNEAEQVYIEPDTYVHAMLGRNINWYSDVEASPLPGKAFVDDADNYWARVTNLYPYNIDAVNDVVAIGYTAPPLIAMNFSTTTTKQQAIDRLNEYYSYVFYDKWSWDATNSKYRPDAYWIPYLGIDAAGGLDLPTKVNLSAGSTTTTDLYPYMVGEIEVDQKGDEKYNFVQVRAQNSSGGWIEHVNCDADTFHPIYNPSTTITTYDLPIEYYEENADILVSTDLTTYSDAIYTYYNNQILTYRCRFKARSDLELYQLVAVSGFDNSTYGMIEDGDYRIIEISYQLDNAAQSNEVEIVLMKASLFTAYHNLKRPFVNTVMEIQKIIKAALAPTQQTITGYCVYGTTGPGTLGYDSFNINLCAASSYISRKRAYKLDGGSWTTSTPWLLTMGSNGILYAKKQVNDTT